MKKSYSNKKLLFIFPQGIGDFLHALDKLIINSININKNTHTFILQYRQQSEILNYIYSDEKKIFLTSILRKNIFSICKLILHLLTNKFDAVIIDPNISLQKINYLKFIYRSKLLIINKKINLSFTKIDAYKEINKKVNKENKESLLNKSLKYYKIYDKNFVGFSVGSGDLEKNKRWPIKYFNELIKLILTNHKNIYINLYGSEDELYLNEYIIKSLTNDFPNRIKIIKTKNINEIFEIFKNLKMFISNDNGLSHFSSLLEVKTFVLYGPTPTYSNGTNNYRIPISIGYKCSPCYDNFRYGCGDTKCMEYLNPKFVYNRIKKHVNEIN